MGTFKGRSSLAALYIMLLDERAPHGRFPSRSLQELLTVSGALTQKAAFFLLVPTLNLSCTNALPALYDPKVSCTVLRLCFRRYAAYKYALEHARLYRCPRLRRSLMQELWVSKQGSYGNPCLRTLARTIPAMDFVPESLYVGRSGSLRATVNLAQILRASP